jgi:branched-chain amino acid transport system permease protein
MAANRVVPYIIILLGLLAILMPLVIVVPEYLLSFLFWFLAYASMATAWAIIGGFAGYISFGHGAFLATGAYASGIAATHLQGSGNLSPIPTLFVLMVVGALSASVLAAGVGFPFLRLRGPYFTVASLLLMKVSYVLVVNTPVLGGGGGLWLPVPPLEISALRYLVYAGAVFMAALAIFLAWKIQHSKLGLGLAAIRSNEDVADGLGVNSFQLKLIALVISAALTGAVGALVAYERGNIYPDVIFDLNISVLVVLSALIGGSANWAGPFIGAGFVRTFDELISTYIGKEISRILFGAMLAIMILVRPHGLLGAHESTKKDVHKGDLKGNGRA